MKDIIVVIKHVQILQEKTRRDAKEVQPANHDTAKELWEAVKQVLGEFTGKTVDPLIHCIEELQKRITHDPECTRILKDLQVMILTSMNDTKVINQDNYFKDLKRVIHELVQKLKKETADNTPNSVRKFLSPVLQEAKELLEGIKSDESSQRLVGDFKELGHDLFFDVTGAPSMKHFSSTMQDMKKMYLPLLQRELHAVTLPAIEGITTKAEFAVSNLCLDPVGLMPESIKVSLQYDMEVKIRDPSTDSAHALITIEVKDIYQSMKEVNFQILMKRSKFHDRGTVDIDVSGLDFIFQWRANYESDKWIFQLEKSKVRTKKLNLKIKSKEHQFMDTIGTKIFGNVIKNRITRSLTEQITAKGQLLTARLEEYVNREDKN